MVLVKEKKKKERALILSRTPVLKGPRRPGELETPGGRHPRLSRSHGRGNAAAAATTAAFVFQPRFLRR